MDITKQKSNPNPREKANPLSILFFTYTLGIFKKGYSKELNVDDLYNPINADRSRKLGDRLEKHWNKQLQASKISGNRPSFLKALILTFWPEYLYLGVLVFLLDSVIRMFQPLALAKLLAYFQSGSDVTQNDGLLYATYVVGLNGLYALFMNQYIMGAFHYGMRVRAACCALIYRKALRLSKTALGDTASGKIVNLLSNDVSRFDIVSILVNHMWNAPISALIVIYFLYKEAGYAALIGVIPVFIVMPIQSYTGKLSAIYRKKTAIKTDERVRLMDEIISGVQVIKMYAWEKPFAKLIKLARKAELKIILKSSYVRALFMTFNMFTTRSALFCTLLTLALMDQPITAARVFVFMNYYNMISATLSTMFVRGISEIAELFVAIKRIQQFLLNDEFKTAGPTNNNSSEIINGKSSIAMKDLTAKWNLSMSENALSHINLSVPKYSLLAIIGPVGSGKSSLLNGILGELEITSGSLQTNGTISYASQEPWVFGGNVRQNILFGAEFNKKRYYDVIRACCLEKDFEQFPAGDLTVVGDRGASLSGGQKARINLARAVYREADIYLLDDPLSAVDVHVSKHLYDECINGFLVDKCRILVTHQVHHLKTADHIVILNNGTIESEGSFTELAHSDNMYARLLTSEPEMTEDDKTKRKESVKYSRQLSVRSYTASMTSAISELSIPESLLIEDNEDPDLEEDKTTLKDLQEESSKGKVKGSLFIQYLLAGGNWCTVSVVSFLFIFTQLVTSATDYFVSFWTTIEEHRALVQGVLNNTGIPNGFNSTDSVLLNDATPFTLPDDNVVSSTLSSIFNLSAAVGNYSAPQNLTAVSPIFNYLDWSKETCLYIYGSLVASIFVIGLARSVSFYHLAMAASQKLHDNMFLKVIKARMRFFDTNSGGRILNRFSKDLGGADEQLPKVILDSTQILLQMTGSLILITIINPYFLIMIGILGVFFLWLRKVFLKSSKNIKRVEGIVRGPVFTHLGASIQGLTTIRASKAQAVLTDEFDKHQDIHTSAWFMFISASSAYGFYMDFFCFFFLIFITFVLILFQQTFGISSGDAGLAITQAMSLTFIVQWGLRQSAEITNQLMSVERLLEYNTLAEETAPTKPKTPPKNWPDSGEISFEHLGLRYDTTTPLVLKDLSIQIKSKEKVGVVGRTGAGKSSLISALFRLACVEGNIQIDNIDTKDLDLQVLRSKISIIPQDPVLFSGTLRYNLDPFEEYDDNVLYKAIQDVELKDPANIINRLENRVMDRGSNYSVGQRQLICLARALVRKNKILMLDEATANVDPQTDVLIQKTIRTKFADCTVLTVAHRLNTIMDSDKVLVMEAGTMVEFEHPHVLLQSPRGKFAKMVAETGKTTADQLKTIARENYLRKKKSSN